ncbi:TPA: Gfo/Idh/MocA family oxidoreductase [archaeon]|jgi:predicted dehydrogenase|uniref:Gfo/Idh/MocA family oxidoreductase n=1 Tax=Candidatus Undinarchaeum marinum TaxID=2756141 RepID=A0A832XIP0_9ARCH|nr:Gfo/Idh/MocA family oxidoreductase [Candidatus Undinarchaeum marinum]
MKVIFFGLGSIGERHARLLMDNFEHELYAFRSGKSSGKNSLGIEEVHTLEEIEKISPDVAFITNPTNLHISTAVQCASQGISLFVEKPLSHNEEGVQKLMDAVKSNDLSLYIAYCMRFHPVIKWLKEHLKNNKAIHATVRVSSYLPNWREGVDHLTHYSAIKDSGGGVLLELSHEIDYLYYLFGIPTIIEAVSSKASRVTTDAEDFADILLSFGGNLNCNLHMNFLSRLNRREMILDFEDHTVVADLAESKVRILSDEDDKVIELPFERDDMYLEQLNYFFDNMGKPGMMNGPDEAPKVLNTLMEIKEAAK